MGFFKKVFGDAADELKKSIEEKKNEMRKSLEDMKLSAMSGFSSHTSSKKTDDDNDDDENEPRIMIGQLENGILTVFEDFSELDDESLEGYEHLKGIIFPSNLTSLESEVICDQEKLEIVDFSKVTLLKEIPDDFISGETCIKEFKIPQGVTHVGDGFLGECGAGTKVFIPSSVTQLGYINGNANNDQIVYLYAPNLDISDVEEDIKTLYVLPKHYGVYARKLKECDSKARLREIPEDMMNIYSVIQEEKMAVPQSQKVKKEQAKPSCLTPPDKMEFEQFDVSENDTLFEHGFRFAQVPESDDIVYDIVNLEDSDLYLKKTNDNRYYRFHMYSPGKLCVEKDLRAYSKVEHTEFDLARYFKDYENDETEGYSEYDVDKKLFYGVDKNIKATSQEYLPLDWVFVQFDMDENEFLGEHGFTYPRDADDVIYDIVKHDDYDLFLVKTNNGRYFRFEPFGTGRLQIDVDLQAYGIAELTPFDFERFCKDYENDEVEEDLDEYEIEDKKAFYGCEQNVQTPKATLTSMTISESKPEQSHDDDDVYDYANKKRLQLMKVNREKHGSLEKEEEFRKLAIEYSVIKDAIKGGERSVEKIKEGIQQELNKAEGKSTDSVPQSIEKKEANENGIFSARLEALISAALQDGVLTDKEREILKRRAESEGEDWDEVEMIIESRLAEMQSITPTAQATTAQATAEKDYNEEDCSIRTPSFSQAEETNIPSTQETIVEASPKTDGTGLIVYESGETEVLSADCKEIADSQYEFNHHIVKVLLPSGIKRIGNKAFHSCEKLKEVDFSKCNQLETIDEEAFRYCIKLEEVNFSKCTQLETIGEKAFCICDKLKKIILPASLVRIEDEAFYHCEKLEYVDFSACIRLEHINDKAFYMCEKIKNIVIPDTVTKIGHEAFGWCWSLRNVVMSSSIEELGENIFHSDLRILDMSKVTRLKTIPKGFGCSKTMMIVPQGVTTIEECAIWVENGKKLFLPASLESFGKNNYGFEDIYLFAPQLKDLGNLLDEDNLLYQPCLYVLPQYLHNFIAQRDAEGISECDLDICEIPDEYLYFYDN